MILNASTANAPYINARFTNLLLKYLNFIFGKELETIEAICQSWISFFFLIFCAIWRILILVRTCALAKSINFK